MSIDEAAIILKRAIVRQFEANPKMADTVQITDGVLERTKTLLVQMLIADGFMVAPEVIAKNGVNRNVIRITKDDYSGPCPKCGLGITCLCDW